MIENFIKTINKEEIDVSRLSRITTFLAVFSFSPFPLSLVSRILTVKYFTHLPLDKSNFNLIDTSPHE